MNQERSPDNGRLTQYRCSKRGFANALMQSASPSTPTSNDLSTWINRHRMNSKLAIGGLKWPAADRDLDDRAAYHATSATGDLGHKFPISAHDTFTLSATQPGMGWVPVCDIKTFVCSDSVDVLRVIHGSRNIQTLLHHGGL